MPKRLVKKGVTVVREGKRVRPEIGKNFDFNADEIERIVGVDPTALAKADAGADDGEAEVASVGETGKKAAAKPAAKTAGKKPAGKAAAKTPDADSDAELEEGGEGEGEGAETGDDDL